MDAVFLRYLPPFFLFEKKSDFLLNLICFFGFWSYSKALSKNGAVAQLARAIRSHRIGQGFNSPQLHHFLRSKPFTFSKFWRWAVFSCLGLSTSFRACLFQNRIPIGYQFLSSIPGIWYPIFKSPKVSWFFPPCAKRCSASTSGEYFRKTKKSRLVSYWCPISGTGTVFSSFRSVSNLWYKLPKLIYNESKEYKTK